MSTPKILVTGGGGFLGGRLVERLLLAEKIVPRAMGYSPAGSVRLCRLPVDLCWCNIRKSEQVAKAVEGCDVVIHCAYGAGGSDELQRAVTVDGTRNLAVEAQKAGVKKFVHISTQGVYSYLPDGGPIADETLPMKPSGDVYCDTKMEAENVLWEMHRNGGLPLTVLRMGNIWGPFSAPYTVGPISAIRAGVISVVNGGKHASNAIHVDNAVEAILLAVREAQAIGQIYHVTDSDELTWEQLYQPYADWIGAELKSIDFADIAKLAAAGADDVGFFADAWKNAVLPILKYSSFQANSTKSLGGLQKKLWKMTPESLRERCRKRVLDNPKTEYRPPALKVTQKVAKPPSADLLHVYGHGVCFSNKKLKEELGYEPRASHEECLAVTKAWAKSARHI